MLDQGLKRKTHKEKCVVWCHPLHSEPMVSIEKCLGNISEPKTLEGSCKGVGQGRFSEVYKTSTATG